MRRLVAIGASLGGLAALRAILRALPADFPLPIAIVQHQSVEGGDALALALGAASALRVREAEDKMPLQPGTVYLAPADYHLLVEEAAPASGTGLHAALDAGAPVNNARPSIDVLFESAAAACGAGAIGVLLTGNSADGAAGLAALARRGGATLVQNPEGACAPAMPRAGLERVPQAAVLGLDALAEKLRDLAGDLP